MTDWDLITEQIRNAMQAVDNTHEAAEELRNHATTETLDDFRAQMEDLCKELSRLKEIMEHQTAYSMDELVDVLSIYFSGKPAAYRRTQRIEG